MVRMRFKAVIIFIIIFACTAVSGCFPSSQDNSNKLKIAYYLGGYGTEWLDVFAEEYTEATGVEVYIEAGTSLLQTIEPELTDGSGFDIYISHNIPVYRYASIDLLEPLDDLYASEVEDGETYEERIDAKALDAYKFNGHYYQAPYTQGVGGIVYNKTLFASKGWSIPTTYNELVALCDTINQDGTVKPFVWPGVIDDYLWDYVVNEWWIQMAGPEKVEQFFKYEDKSVFDVNDGYKEFKAAYQLWYDLIAAKPQNSVEGTHGNAKIFAQADFANQKAAMMPNAHWLYNEMKDMGLSFDMAIMETPLAPSAKTNQSYNYMVGFPDSMVVAKKSDKISEAKDFLRFIAKRENCARFTEMTNGSFLAFDYSDTTINYNNVDTRGREFVESVKSKLDNSQNFSSHSKNPIAFMTYQKVMTWPGNQYFYVSAVTNSSSYISGNVTPDRIFNYLTNYVNNNWSAWKQSAGV